MERLMHLLCFLLVLVSPTWLLAQGSSVNETGDPAHPSAMLDISSTDKGLLLPRMTTTDRLNITNPAPGLLVYDITGMVLLHYNGVRWMEVGSDPLGTIKAWHKSFPDTPALPWGWVECNGQVLNDSESPYDGKLIPDLNNAIHDTIEGGYFLRGNLVSGVFQNDSLQKHKHLPTRSGTFMIYSGLKLYNGGAQPAAERWPTGSSIPDWYVEGTNDCFEGGSETRPYNMSVVWIIRIK